MSTWPTKQRMGNMMSQLPRTTIPEAMSSMGMQLLRHRSRVLESILLSYLGGRTIADNQIEFYMRSGVYDPGREWLLYEAIYIKDLSLPGESGMLWAGDFQINNTRPGSVGWRWVLAPWVVMLPGLDAAFPLS